MVHYHYFTNTFLFSYFDFETVQIDDSKTTDVKTLKAYQYSLIFVDKFNKLLFEERKFCPQGRAGEKCLDTLLNIENKPFSHARRIKTMKMSKKDREVAKIAKKCHICEENFEENERRFRDHCHYSSRFLG